MLPYITCSNYPPPRELFQLSSLFMSSYQFINQETEHLSKITDHMFTLHCFKSPGTIVYDKIIEFLTPSISVYQFGFLSKCSVVHQLLTFLHMIFSSFTANSQTVVAYLDIRESFDSIPHNLFKKFWSVGICGGLWAWFKGYLLYRIQCVSIHGHQSDFLPVLSGVPQESILGPLLFLIYVNDLPAATAFSILFMFADDTKCLKNVSNISDCCLL